MTIYSMVGKFPAFSSESDFVNYFKLMWLGGRFADLVIYILPLSECACAGFESPTVDVGWRPPPGLENTTYFYSFPLN